MLSQVCEDCGNGLSCSSFESYCARCGFVAEDSPIDFGRDSFVDLDRPGTNSRTGAPITWLNPNFSTTFNLKRKKRY